MSNMNLRNACDIRYHLFLFYVQHTILCYSVSCIYILCPTYYFMSNMNLQNACDIQYYAFLFMSNILFYVQHESTKCMLHSVLRVFILMSNILVYVQHRSTNCMLHSVSCVFILCPTHNFVSIICVTCHFMSNMNLQNAYDIQYY